MIRVAQVLEASVGGTKRHVLALAEGLDRGRFEQTLVIGTGRTGALGPEWAATGLPVVPFRAARAISLGGDWRAYRQLESLLAGGGFDLVHCHSAKAGFLGRMAARSLERTKRIYSPHCFPFAMQAGAARRRLYLALERWAGRHTDLLVAVSRAEAEEALRKRIVSAERLATVPNGIRIADFQQHGAREATRAELGVGASEVLVLSVGLLDGQKGHRHLVEAAALLRPKCPRLRVAIAGEGPLRRGLQLAVDRLGLREHVTLLGHRDDVPQLLAAADLFVLPSLWEGLPYALLEAMAAAVPVVVSRVGGMAEVVREGKTGLLADAGISASLAARLREALGHSERMARMAGAAWALVATEYTEERWLRDMAATYERVAASG